MSDEVEDPSDEVVQRVGTVAVGAAAAAARRLGDELKERAEERRQAEQAEAQQLGARWEAERAAALAQVQAGVDGGLGRSTPEQAAQAWAVANAWSEVDGTFDPHQQRLRAEIRERWGVDVAASGGDAAGLRAEADRARARERSEDASRNYDEAMAGGILAATGAEVDAMHEADRHRTNAVSDSAAAADLDSAADAAYDTDTRREQLSARAQSAGVDAPTAEGRSRAANANGKPVAQATGGRRATKARRRGRGGQQQRGDQLSR